MTIDCHYVESPPLEHPELRTPSERVDAALIAAAAHGLMGSLAEPPAAPPAAGEWRELLHRAEVQRVTGLLARMVLSGKMPATAEQVEQIQDLETQILCHALATEAVLVRYAGILDQNHIPFRVLTGPAAARLDYPDAPVRDFGDLDLLIRPEDFDRTLEVLTAHGCRRRFPQLQPGFDRRFAKSVSVTTPEGVHLDLHRTLAPGPHGLRIDLDALWQGESTPLVVGGGLVEALGADERFLHACYHAALGDDAPPRLVTQRDIAQMLLFGSVDADRVRRLAAGWQGEAVVAHAVTKAWSTLRIADVLALSAWAARYQPSAREGREFAHAISPAKSCTTQALASVRAIPGVRDRMAYVTALILSKRSHLEGPHNGYGERIAHIRTPPPIIPGPRHEATPVSASDDRDDIR